MLLAWGSSITLKSNGGTLESAQFEDTSSLTLASDLSITRSVFRGNSYALSFFEDAILDIGDYTLSIYDKATQTTSAGVGAFQASIIKAGSKGKIIAYAKESAIGHSGDILKSFRTYSSSVDDLGFLGFSYPTAPEAGNKLILVPDGGDPTKDAIATFDMDGDFKDFAVLVPAATEGTPYNLYYNQKLLQGIMSGLDNVITDYTHIFTARPTEQWIVSGLKDYPVDLDVTQGKTQAYFINISNNFDGDQEIIEYSATWRDNISTEHYEQAFNGTITGRNSSQLFINVPRGINGGAVDMTFRDLTLYVKNFSAVELTGYAGINLHLEGTTTLFSSRSSLISSVNTKYNIDDATSGGDLVLFGMEPITNEGEISNLIEWVWNETIEKDAIIELRFKDGSVKMFMAPQAFRSFAYNTTGPVELFINGKQQKGHLGLQSYTIFSITDDNLLTTYSEIENAEASIIESKFTLQKEGNGEFKASYTYLKDETDPESEVTETIYADTTYTVVNSERFTITATPGEGAELVKVVQVKGDEEIELPNIKAGEPFEYNVVVTDTLKAYFKTTTLVVDQETTINGEDLTDIENIVIEANGQAETPTTVIFDGVKITDPKTGTTTIEKEANVILEISGQNSLGEIINHGTLIINPFYGFLDYRGVENNGQFTDYSSAIRSVTGTAALEITPLENKEVQEGESVTLTTTADAGGEVSFVWEKYENDTWIQVKPQVEEIATKATLRSTSKSDELKVSSLECGSYRCLISYENGTAKTTLTTYADVILKTEEPTEPDPEEPIEPEPEEPTDPIDPVDPTPSLYTVTIAEVCEGVTLESSTKTVEAGQDVTITLTVADGYDISGLELSYKLGTNGEWQDLTTLENGTFGQYIIKNVKDDVSVKATGAVYTAIEQVEGVKVYTANGILYVETPCRMPITIVSLTGVVIRHEESIGMRQYDNLNSGVYIVRVGDRIFKVRIG